MYKRRIAVGAAALAGLIATAQGVTSPAHAAATGPLFGVVDGRILGGTPAQVNAALNQDAALGVTAVREQLSWNAVEPSKGLYNWGPFDQMVSSIAAHHMKLLLIVDFTPAWARPSGCTSWACAPAQPQQFAAFAGQAAARYGSQVAAWEVWNEPNSGGFWQPSPNAAGYSALLTDTAAAIRSASPGAYVVSAGLAPEANDGLDIAPTTFLSGMCTAGALNSVDAVGDHPYSFPVPPDYAAPWNAWQQMNNTPTSLRSIMAGCGAASKPIWITEYGAPTNGPGPAADVGNYDLAAHPNHVTLALQNQIISNSVSDVRTYPWVGALFLYSASDAGTSLTTYENFFGLSDSTGAPKPSWNSLQSALG